MSFSNLIVRALDMLVREPKFLWKYYLKADRTKGKVDKNRYVFMVDGLRGHGGMFDRLKGLITIYAIAKAQQKKFAIHFDYPFKLENYLQPAYYDWRLEDDEPVRHWPESSPLIAYGEYANPKRLMKNRRRETHFYYGYNSLDDVNAHFSTDFKWGDLYHELFKPTPYLQKHIDFYKKDIGERYIVVHTRFLNLLGDKMETDINPILPESKREALKNKILKKIEKLISLYDDATKVMLASDSMHFLEYMQEMMPRVYVIPGNVKHIDTAGHTDDSENIKMFLDYYLISGAYHVYNIVAEGMWPSAFPEYAAKIGGKPFTRINLDS